MARFWHFWFAVAFFLVYLWLKHRRPESRLLLHPLALALAVPLLYLGSAISDWDIRLLGIGRHRNPLFHSAVPYYFLAYLWHLLILQTKQSSMLGQRLSLAFHVSLALGLSSHLVLDVIQYGDVRWIPGGRLDRLWLSGNAVLLGLVAWFPPTLPEDSAESTATG
jgi:hypothetical protein